MIRTQEQIVERLRSNDERDPLGFSFSDLVVWLDYEHAKEFVRPEVTAAEWAEQHGSPKPVRDQMIDYMPFAWEKANNCRGISAGRSLNHYQAWLWLLGEDGLADSLSGYQYYGKNELTRICEFLGLDAKQWDDGARVNTDG